MKLLSLVLRHLTYFILDEPEVQALAKLAKKNLHIDRLTKATDLREVSFCMSVYLCLWKHFETDYDAELQEAAVQWIVNNLGELLATNSDVGQKDKSFHLNVLLNFLTSTMDRMGMLHFGKIIVHMPEDTLMVHKQEKLKDLRGVKAAQDAIQSAVDAQVSTEEPEEATLEALILHVVSISHEVELEPETFINLLTLVRKVIPDAKIITEKQFLIDEIIEIAKDKVVNFNRKLNAFIKQQQAADPLASQALVEISSMEEKMLASFADTLMTCALYINEQVNEDSLFILISSGFEQLQKAAFFMLRHLFQQFVPAVLFKKDEEQEIKQLQLMAQGQEIEEAKEEDAEPKEVLAKDKVEFRNVSRALLDLIEHPPAIDTHVDSDDEQTELKPQIEEMIFGSTKDGCLSKKVFGYLLAWSSLLQKIDNGGIKAQLLNRDDYTAILNTISEFLEQNRFIYQMLLVIIVAYLPKVKKTTIGHQAIIDFDPSQVDLEDPRSGLMMALFTLVSFMKSFPSLARKYY